MYLQTINVVFGRPFQHLLHCRQHVRAFQSVRFLVDLNGLRGSRGSLSSGLGIYKRKKESKKTRKHALVHANTHASTQKRTRARKHARKHALVHDFLVFVRVFLRVFFFSFINSQPRKITTF